MFVLLLLTTIHYQPLTPWIGSGPPLVHSIACSLCSTDMAGVKGKVDTLRSRDTWWGPSCGGSILITDSSWLIVVNNVATHMAELADDNGSWVVNNRGQWTTKLPWLITWLIIKNQPEDHIPTIWIDQLCVNQTFLISNNHECYCNWIMVLTLECTCGISSLANGRSVSAPQMAMRHSGG